MAVSLNTNIAALGTQRRLAESTAKLSKSFARLSSGLRINSAGDDAAGLAISETLKADARVFLQGIRNLNDGVSITNIAESTLNEMTNIVTRIQELAEQSANGTLSNKQRASIDAEAQALSKEYFRVSRVAEFNGLRLFDGSNQGGFRFQSGYGEQGGISSSLGGSLGAGTFSEGTTLGVDGAQVLSTKLGDLNGDGILDVVTAGYDDSNVGFVAVRLGIGDGTFGQVTSYTSETGRTKAGTLADVNGDGILDVTTSGTDGTVGRATVRLGRGDGTFGQATSYTTEGLSYAVTYADLNNDDRLDLLTAGYFSGDGYATIRLGRGDGTFGGAVSYRTENYQSFGAAVGDLNGDGQLDLVTGGSTDGGNGYITARLGRGDGTFGAALSYQSEGAVTTAVALGDLNSDGILDVVSSGSFSSNGWATVRLGCGDGTFAQATSYAVESYKSQAVTLADLNGDSVLDIATCGQSDPNEAIVSIMLGRGDGQFNVPLSISLLRAGAAGESFNAIASGDLNRDGVIDLAVGGQGSFGGGGSDGATQIILGDRRDGAAPLLPFSLRSKADALQAIPMMKDALTRVSSQRGKIGALQSRLNTAVANLQVARENYDSARSQITDVDAADESSELLKTQIVQQAASSILSQANQSPALALTLMRG